MYCTRAVPPRALACTIASQVDAIRGSVSLPKDRSQVAGWMKNATIPHPMQGSSATKLPLEPLELDSGKRSSKACMMRRHAMATLCATVAATGATVALTSACEGTSTPNGLPVCHCN